MRKLFCASALALAALTSSAHAAPDGHAPIGVSGDHLHHRGEWMLSYKFQRATASGLGHGANVFSAFGEAPLKMDMDMHMFELMYGVTDDLTLMLMPQYMKMHMLHYSPHGGGHSHVHEIEGFGDTEASALYSLFRSERLKAHLNFGVTLPTGDIDKTFSDHHGNPYPLPYNMQFGSGTVDPVLGATVTSDETGWSWGAQTMNTLRLYRNGDHYRQGNEYSATAWAAANVTDFASLSLRVKGEVWEDASGRNPSLPLTTIAGGNPKELGGSRVTAYTGINLQAPSGALAGHRLALEFGLPLYEHYSGPQPDSDYSFTLGWQKAF